MTGCRACLGLVVEDCMIEGIAAYSSSAAQVSQAADTSIAVAKKVLNQQKVEGQAAISLIQSVDLPARPAGPTGDHTGRHVNVRA